MRRAGSVILSPEDSGEQAGVTAPAPVLQPGDWFGGLGWPRLCGLRAAESTVLLSLSPSAYSGVKAQLEADPEIAERWATLSSVRGLGTLPAAVASELKLRAVSKEVRHSTPSYLQRTPITSGVRSQVGPNVVLHRHDLSTHGSPPAMGVVRAGVCTETLSSKPGYSAELARGAHYGTATGELPAACFLTRLRVPPAEFRGISPAFSVTSGATGATVLFLSAATQCMLLDEGVREVLARAANVRRALHAASEYVGRPGA